MLDKRSLKILRFLASYTGESFTEHVLFQKGLDVEYPAMESLYQQNYVVRSALEDWPLNEWESPTYEYRIDPRGLAALEEQKRINWNDVRAWITLLIAVAAFVKSFFF